MENKTRMQTEINELWTDGVIQFQEALQALDDVGQTAADAGAPDDLLDHMRGLLERIRAASYGYAQNTFEQVSNCLQSNWDEIEQTVTSAQAIYDAANYEGTIQAADAVALHGAAHPERHITQSMAQAAEWLGCTEELDILTDG